MGRVYDLALLQKFRRNLFIIYRSEYEEISFTYDTILGTVSEVLEQFKLYNVIPNVGIALQIQSLTASGIVLLLSILNYNCYFIPLHYNTAQSHFEAVLNAHGAKYVIADLKYDNGNCKQIGCVTVFHNKMYIYENTSLKKNACVDVPSLCYSIATSGTTGLPKIVQVPYSCMEPNIVAISTQLKISESDVIYLCAPFTFDPFMVDLFLALNRGATLLISAPTLRLNPNKLIKILWPKLLDHDRSLLRENSNCIGATFLQATPSFFRLFGDAAIKDVILHESNSLRCLVLGGEDFPTRLEWNSWLPSAPINKRIFNIYGITELSCWCTMHECNFNDGWERAPLGALLDNQTSLRIIDKSGMELSGVCEGQLEIGSATRKCYIPSIDGQFSHESTELCFRATGDVVRQDESGNVFYLGRIDSIIKRRGVRLNLEILQQNIQMLLKTEPRNIKCVWQEEMQKLICFIETSADYPNSGPMHIRRLLSENLIEIKRPDDIKFIRKFPLNSHGKVDIRCMLSQIAEDTCQQSVKPVEILQSFIIETLGFDPLNPISEVPRISTSNKPDPILSFTAAGGTSFQAIVLASEIGPMLEHTSDRSELLGMLLNPQQSLISIKDFLVSCSLSKTQIISKVQSNKRNYCLAKNFKFLWRTSLNKCVDSSPIIVGNKWICVGSHSHILATLDGRQGNPIAVLELPDRIECKVEVALNDKNPYMAFVGCYDHYLYAFNYTNGRIYWRIDMSGIIKAKPLSCKSGLIVATYGKTFNVFCVCLKTQNYIWRQKVGAIGIFASPVLINDAAMIICALDGTYCSVSADSGKCQWLQKCGSPIFSTPIVISEENIIILAEVVGKVHICNTESGEVIKTFCAGSSIFSGLTTIPDMNSKVQGNDTRSTKILFGCYDKNVYCLQYMNAADENQQSTPVLHLLWKVQLDSNIFATPVAISMKEDNFVLSCSINGLIALLLAETGELVATHKLPAEVFSTPCQLNNQIFLGCRDNYVYSFSIK
ncbi:beta-alanine-activating enzyme isoform X1 [Anastrepha ludens]|uniref:beta-alanine-activating enzyme isoform X1 n=3 Tax=Anastrepha ludens TaxID=28586 RepID=UPI0023B0BAF1|nr:beta-alanine-activating enzyme isoform X1 [Anastrepha ludens]